MQKICDKNFTGWGGGGQLKTITCHEGPSANLRKNQVPALHDAVTIGEKTLSGSPGGLPNEIISSSGLIPPES